MKLGQQAMEALKAQIDGSLKQGDDLVVAGVIGIRGTQLLMQKERETLLQYFLDGFLWSTARILEKCSVSADISEIFKGKVHARYDLGVGGVLSGMWKMAEASETGLRADLRAIPVRQETIEICERLDVNPYKLLSEGAVLLGCTDGEKLVQELSHHQIPAAVIGKAVAGNDRLLYSGELTRYLERPSQDELTRFAWGGEWRKDKKWQS